MNGVGFILTSFILISVIIIKFQEGGWITLLIAGLLAMLAMAIRRHYYKIKLRLRKLRLKAYSRLEEALKNFKTNKRDHTKKQYDPDEKTAILLVSGFGGTGLYTFLRINESFKEIFKNFILLRIGVINSKIYRGHEEI